LVLTVDDLLEVCTALRAKGTDFPTLWTTLLKNNRLVVGNPIQVHENGQPTLKIRLVTNQFLVYAANRFSLEIGSASRLTNPGGQSRNAA
jgi:hypothetical protein